MKKRLIGLVLGLAMVVSTPVNVSANTGDSASTANTGELTETTLVSSEQTNGAAPGEASSEVTQEAPWATTGNSTTTESVSSPSAETTLSSESGSALTGEPKSAPAAESSPSTFQAPKAAQAAAAQEPSVFINGTWYTRNQLKKANIYFSVLETDYEIWTDETFKTLNGFSEDILEETFKATDFFIDEGELYWGLTAANKQFIGYINDDALAGNETASPAGVPYDEQGYVTIKAGTKLLSNVATLTPQKTGQGKTQTLQIYESYTHFNGHDYFALQNNKKQHVGYVDAASVKYNSAAQGDWQKDSAYATISKNYKLYSSFNWQVKNDGAKLLGKTYKITGKYLHFNGSTYYSLQNNKGTWMGYINAAAIKRTTGAQGAWQPESRYVTVMKNYQSYKNFDKWTVSKKAAALKQRTYKVTGKYVHFNGSTYYSMQDNKKNWLGYINAAATYKGKGPQGYYISCNKKVKVTSKNYNLYSNFDWKVKGNTKYRLNKTYVAKTMYRHFNGSLYYSLYTPGGSWIGYLNAAAVK